MVANATRSSRLIDYLPAIYQEDWFLKQFLLGFEKILLGINDEQEQELKGLEEEIADIAVLFDPQETRREFLPWLSSWTAFSFSFRADLTEQQQRKFIAKIIPLYRDRGTKKYVEELLKIFTIVDEPNIKIEEPAEWEFQIGDCSIVGKNTYIGGAPPHFFKVTLILEDLLEQQKQPNSSGAPIRLKKQLEIAKALIELAKPAHTYYQLIVVFPGMQIGVHSTVGVDTLLGTDTEKLNLIKVSRSAKNNYY